MKATFVARAVSEWIERHDDKYLRKSVTYDTNVNVNDFPEVVAYDIIYDLFSTIKVERTQMTNSKNAISGISKNTETGTLSVTISHLSGEPKTEIVKEIELDNYI